MWGKRMMEIGKPDEGKHHEMAKDNDEKEAKERGKRGK